MFIQLQSVTKNFGSIRAVDDLSLTVSEGDIYGFLGPNGSGKSTSIRMLLSLIRPTAGNILLFGKDLSTHRYQVLSRIGALIEKPDFYKYLSARKNLEILGRLSNIDNRKTRVEEVLDIVGLLSRADSKVRTFSQGMKQRLGIAQAILHKPDLIILDEPTNGLDPQGQKEIRELILSLKKDQHITILISSHILFEMEQIANRMIIINKGKALVEGNVRELLQKREQHVSLMVDRTEAAILLVQKSEWGPRFLLHENGKLRFSLTKEEIPILTAFLTQNEFRIYAIEPVRSLEDFFLQITEDGKSDPN